MTIKENHKQIKKNSSDLQHFDCDIIWKVRWESDFVSVRQKSLCLFVFSPGLTLPNYSINAIRLLCTYSRLLIAVADAIKHKYKKKKKLKCQCNYFIFNLWTLFFYHFLRWHFSLLVHLLIYVFTHPLPRKSNSSSTSYAIIIFVKTCKMTWSHVCIYVDNLDDFSTPKYFYVPCPASSLMHACMSHLFTSQTDMFTSIGTRLCTTDIWMNAYKELHNKKRLLQ